MALTNMVQGLAMFDGQERLVLANVRYAELFGLDPEEIEPGTTLKRVIERRAAKGHYPNVQLDAGAGRIAATHRARQRYHLVNLGKDACCQRRCSPGPMAAGS